ncbi:hypothetical protein CMI47_01310 [Candidatus Pacearchaeota archaeon]|nr:hypothetical protein [Candidatus Pacearchaeota archaeon]|tara:strand:- start:253 stop:744 length:492 start_codon:yes stop_codon:yes gene_type:complete
MEHSLESYLKKLDIKYKEHKHKAVFTVEEHDTTQDAMPSGILHTKNLFLKDNKGNFYLVCMYAKKPLDMKSLRKKFGVKKLHFAAPEELKAHLNLTPGSVSIFGMIHAKEVKLLLDEQVWKADLVGFHPNMNTSTLELTHKDLKKFYDSLKSEKEIINLEDEA